MSCFYFLEGHMDWRWQTMGQLSQAELYAILAARQEVFIVDQKIRYVDADGKDFSSYHLSGRKDGALVAYLRMIPLAEKNHYKIGRVLTRLPYRGQGYGEALIRELLGIIDQTFAPCTLTMAAQQYLENFYAKFGFRTEGPVFYEEGLAHITMTQIR